MLTCTMTSVGTSNSAGDLIRVAEYLLESAAALPHLVANHMCVKILESSCYYISTPHIHP